MTTTQEHQAGGHHETPEQRHLKEHIALWLFIGGDFVFFALEIFTWFYLRALNVHGMWRGAACSAANPCTSGDGTDLTHIVPTAPVWHSLAVGGLVLLSALFIWQAEERARSVERRAEVTGWITLGVLTLIAGIVIQCIQFTALPFLTVDGAYASAFIFFMGTILAHLILTLFLGISVLTRVLRGHYDRRWGLQLRLVRIWWLWVALSGAALGLIAVYGA